MTHASEHNAISTMGPATTLTDAAPKRREMKVQQPRDRDEETAGEGDDASVGTGATNDTTFLDPVPFYVPVAGCGTEGASSAEPASCDPSAGFSVVSDILMILAGRHLTELCRERTWAPQMRVIIAWEVAARQGVAGTVAREHAVPADVVEAEVNRFQRATQYSSSIFPFMNLPLIFTIVQYLL